MQVTALIAELLEMATAGMPTASHVHPPERQERARLRELARDKQSFVHVLKHFET